MGSSKNERSMSILATSSDNVLLRKILDTHTPDGRHINAEPLVHVIEIILKHATASTTPVSQGHIEAVMDEFTNNVEIVELEPLGCTIHKISCEMWCKCFEASGSHVTTTMALLSSLGNFTWDAKVVLVLVAFVMSYGELWLMAQLCIINPLAESLVMFKQLPNKLKHDEVPKPFIKALNSLVRAMLEVTKCIIEFEDLPLQYINLENEIMVAAKTHIPIATYWTVRSAVVCCSRIIDLIATKHEQMHSTSTTVTWELWSLVYKVINIHAYLRKQLDACHQHTELEAYIMLLHHFEETHSDNQKILGEMFPSKDSLPLKHGSSSRKFSVDVLRSKQVILLISSIDIAHEELLDLVKKAYNYSDHNNNEQIKRDYEIVWVPIMEKTMRTSWCHDIEGQVAFNGFASTLPCYYICQPWLLNLGLVKYVKEMWKLEKDEALMVVLDPQGRVMCPNAIHMFTIWGTSRAYPFSTSREEVLWREANWTMEFVMGNIDLLVSEWIKKGRIICLYGSEDWQWIREFTNKMKDILLSGVSIEMVYVGRSKPSDHTEEIVATIMKENLSGYLSRTQIYLFWVRLESMKKSRMQHMNKNNTTDFIMEQVMSTLNLDASYKGWSMMGSKGSEDIIQLAGRKNIELLSLFEIWGKDIKKEGFLRAIGNALDPLPPLEHSNNFVIPYDSAPTVENEICYECKRPMEKYILYQCCNK